MKFTLLPKTFNIQHIHEASTNKNGNKIANIKTNANTNNDATVHKNKPKLSPTHKQTHTPCSYQQTAWTSLWYLHFWWYFCQTSDFPKVKSTSPAREDWGIWHTFHSRPERCFVVESHDFVHISGWERILLTFSWVFFCMLRPCQAFFKSHNSQVNKRDLPKYCSTTLPRDYFRFQLKDVPLYQSCIF